MDHLVQIGILGAIGRFRSTDSLRFDVGETVICRTARGLEVGLVLKPLHHDPGYVSNDGDLLRKVTPEDRLLMERIDRFRDRAFSACQNLLRERGLTATLVDVEHLFDGQALYFYFLGDVDQRVNQLTSELAETYEAKVRFRKFSQTLAQGCGPDCGTSESSGCQSTGCGSCVMRQACKPN